MFCTDYQTQFYMSNKKKQNESNHSNAKDVTELHD